MDLFLKIRRLKSIKDEQYIKLDINMVNDVLNNMIDETVNDFYSSSFQALNNKDKNIISRATEEVKELVYNYIWWRTYYLPYNVLKLQVWL